MSTPYVQPHPLTGRYDDAAHRIADAIALEIAARGISDAAGRWMAFKLRDGRAGNSNGRHESYLSPDSAIAYWRSADPLVLYQIQTEGITPRAAAIRLTLCRQAYDRGYRISGVHDGILDTPLHTEDLPR